ncbi:hypothetical protein D5086_004751 [Populus alba]|uniref:Uncharacterized protein n=1 Tax=Populus alba TaxID=43335 RepID=A0ACC4CRT2_POPAL
MFTMINLFSLLALSFLTSQAKAQQNYSKNSALDCNASDETGPSSPFPYSCNGQSQSCQAFLIFKSQPSLHSVPAISVLTSANEEELARINYVTRLSEFPTNKEVIVPVNCSCFGQYYQANTTIQATTTRGTYYVIANDTYMRDYLLALRLSAGIHMLSSSSLATREETLVTESCRERKLVVREDLRAKIASYEQVLKVFEFEKVKKAILERVQVLKCFGVYGKWVPKKITILERVQGKWKLDREFRLLWMLLMDFTISTASPNLLMCTVHQDIKSSNVLLNGNPRAKISNFSLARDATRKTSAALTKHVVGTTWRPRKDAVFTQDGKESLLSTAIVSIMERENPEAELDFYVDPGLKGICGTDFVLCLTKVSVACLMKEPVRRPNMEEVVSILLKIQANVLKS